MKISKELQKSKKALKTFKDSYKKRNRTPLKNALNAKTKIKSEFESQYTKIMGT